MLNEKGTNWLEVVLIIALFTLLIIPFIIFKLWWWAIFMALVAIVFAIMEVVAHVVTGRTLSQKFWDWSIRPNANGKKPNIWKAWLVLGSMLGAWIMLLIHLAWKMIR